MTPLHTPLPVGDKDVAPPGVVWTEEGTHKGRPYGIRNRGSTRCAYTYLRDLGQSGPDQQDK